MFSMEEVEGSAKRPQVWCSAPSQRTSSLSDANASDDDNDEDDFIYPILDDSAKEICNYLKNLVNTRDLSNSLPRTSLMYRVSLYSKLYIMVHTCGLISKSSASSHSQSIFVPQRRHSSAIFCGNSCLP